MNLWSRFDAVLVGLLPYLSFVQADNHCKTLAETLGLVVGSMRLPLVGGSAGSGLFARSFRSTRRDRIKMHVIWPKVVVETPVFELDPS